MRPSFSFVICFHHCLCPSLRLSPCLLQVRGFPANNSSAYALLCDDLNTELQTWLLSSHPDNLSDSPHSSPSQSMEISKSGYQVLSILSSNMRHTNCSDLSFSCSEASRVQVLGLASDSQYTSSLSKPLFLTRSVYSLIPKYGMILLKCINKYFDYFELLFSINYRKSLGFK